MGKRSSNRLTSLSQSGPKQGCQKRPTSLVLIRILVSCLQIKALQQRLLMPCALCTLAQSMYSNDVLDVCSSYIDVLTSMDGLVSKSTGAV